MKWHFTPVTPQLGRAAGQGAASHRTQTHPWGGHGVAPLLSTSTSPCGGCCGGFPSSPHHRGAPGVPLGQAPCSFTPGPSHRDTAHHQQQPTSGPAPAFASPHGGAAQRGLELTDLDGRVGAETLLELLHQGLHRLLRHLGSCNTNKGTVVRRCPSAPSPTGTALSSGSLSPLGQHGTPACQVTQRAPPNLSQKHRNKQRRSLQKLHFFFMLLYSSLDHSLPLPALGSLVPRA